jgi:outer membrane protein OmpA-like peptidoglycan-associated protein
MGLLQYGRTLRGLSAWMAHAKQFLICGRCPPPHRFEIGVAMRSATEIRLLSSLSALSSCWFVNTLYAQAPQVAAEATALAAASAPPVFQGQAAATTSATSEDSAGDDSFLYRYKPAANVFELGAFIGPAFISDDNSFRGASRANPGSNPTVMPYSTFKKPSVEFGVRGAYYPFSFVGGELEGMVAAAETDRGDGVSVLVGRAQVVVQAPYWSVVPFLVGGVGWWQVNNGYSGNDSDPAFHFGGGAKVNVTNQISLRLDIRDSITNQRALTAYPHNVETVVGGALMLGRPAPAPKDSDQDGYVDPRDACPLEAGTLPNGCPVRDTDGDGIDDPVDECVNVPGVAPTGCPVLDADLDGVPDGSDQCVNESGAAPTGCPDGDMDGFLDRDDKCPAVPGVAPDGCLVDSDQDGFVGADDRCPDQAETKNGFEDTDGCPDELPAEVKNFVGVIAGVEFDTNKDVIRDSSAAVLARALKILADYPSLRVEIIGHTDDRGSREHNLDLSQRRAAAVKNHLVVQGIDPRRVQTRGAGPDEPLVPNTSLVGRQKNRRIEFRVIE